MLFYKSFDMALSHAAQCFASEASSIADTAMGYAEGLAPNGDPLPEPYSFKDAGEMPIWSAAYCADIFANDLSNDESLSEEDAQAAYRELYLALADHFGIDAMIDIPESYLSWAN